ncbi:MAG: DJ-1/PfpI family protein [Bacteroidaceae bacterium]|nr:DJ-1/PfpI family protein [Bacteroidaceae bacterium]
MNKVYIFLADGFETVEALAPVDVMRRAGLSVTVVSIMGRYEVLSAQGVPVIADALIGDFSLSDADAIVLPGGGAGTENLSANSAVREEIERMNNEGKLIAAICAAPMVFGRMGILQGKRATCYPGCEGDLKGAEYTASDVEIDGNIMTACGPGVSFDFGFAIVEHFCGAEKVSLIRSQMQFDK